MIDKVVRVIDCHIARETDEGLRYLVLKRSDSVVCPNHWQCVTGKIIKNETPYYSAIREVKEETGLDAIRMWTVDTVNFFYEHTRNQLNIVPVFGIIVGTHDVHLSHEHTEYRWCSIDTALDMLIWTKQVEGLREFDGMLRKKTEKNNFLEIDLHNES